MNGFEIWGSQSKYNQTFKSLLSQNSSFIANKWTLSSIYNDSSNPIADIFLSLSRPCGRRGSNYGNRTLKVDQMYNISDCPYNEHG